jgi:hypothetical protein
VEFAMVSFILYMLMVVLLDLGRASLATQTIQSAADVFATELARAPVPATNTFEEALDEEYVSTTIYDEDFLVVVLDENHDTQAELDDFFAGLPIVNQVLRPLMIRDTLPDGMGTEVLRYPGAILAKQGSASGFTVMIPLVQYPSAAAGETILEWLPVIQEVLPSSQAPSNFPINSTGPFPGFVNVRIHYPYQAAAMSAFDGNVIIEGEDSAVTDSATLPDGTSMPAWPDDSAPGPYSGPYGLGHHYAFVKKVRPYRKVLSIQAAARREGIYKP